MLSGASASRLQALPIARIVLASCNRAWLIVLVGIALLLLATVHTVRHFAMMTDSLQLISPDVSWRKNKAAFDHAFPQFVDLIVAVVDGATPELAEEGAAELAARLSARADLFQSVRRPDGGPFFQRNGLLFLSETDVADATAQLIAAQSFLGPLAGDPSLHGVMGTLSTALEGLQQHQVRLEDLERPLGSLAHTIDRVVQGEPAFFSWRELVSGQPPSLRETRRVVLIQPKLDNAALMPGAAPSGAIRQAARELVLEQANGVRVRLTGSVALADEELATLSERAVPIAAAMMSAVLVMLWLAVRTARTIACILITTFAGLAITAGLGLFVVGRFNLVSVAFIPLFVGLGIDFSIQFCVRYRAERFVHRDLKAALVAAGNAIGASLALAAAAMAAGFFAFLPTAYVGASELGLIAGIGMVIAFLLNMTLLPALLTLVRLKDEAAGIGLAFLAPLDRWLVDRRKLVLAIAAAAAAISLGLLPWVRFDFNPLHLRRQAVDSVRTLLDLTSDPDKSPNTIDLLAPSLAEADGLAERVSLLPEVARTLTLRSFVPDHQSEKLALIADASSLLDVALNPIEVRPKPTDEETVESMLQTANSLREAAGTETTWAANRARQLARALDALAAGPPAMRARASETLTAPLSFLLDQLRAQLRAAPVTLETLPQEIVQDWLTEDGRARIQVVPRGDSNDNRTLERFADAVRRVAPDATGPPISIQEAAHVIVKAFIQAGIWSFLAVLALLALALRHLRDVILTLIPIALGGMLTLASCVLLGQPFNFANIIALPLLFGIGVAFNIYFVVAWRSGEASLLASSLTRAVLFSALTTATAFGSLWLSTHPGTASLGRLLMMSLGWTLVTTLLFEPALLGPPPRRDR